MNMCGSLLKNAPIVIVFIVSLPRAMPARLADEINTTFAIESTEELSLEEALMPAIIQKYNAKTTGGKYILIPNKG
jgi:hypothetical protein